MPAENVTAVAPTGAPPPSAEPSPPDDALDLVPDNQLWADEDPEDRDVLIDPPPAKPPEPAEPKAEEPASKDGEPPPEAAPTPGHNLDVGLQKLQQEFTTMRGESQAIQQAVNQLVEKLGDSNGQPAAPAATNGQAQAPAAAIKDAFTDVDLYEPDQLQQAITEAVAASSAITLDAISQRLDSIDQRITSRAADDYWSKWHADTGLDKAQRETIQADAAKYVDEKYGYGEGSTERAAAINVHFDHLADQMVASKKSEPKPNASASARHKPNPDPTESAEIVPPGASARTGPVSNPDDIYLVPDHELWVPD